MDARLQDYLYRSAERAPDRVALVMGDERWTYGETLDRTACLAAALADHGAGPGTRVVVLAEKSPATVAALLAVLATGAAYVPIDPASPAARVTRIVSAAEPAVLLTDAASAPLVDALVDETFPVVGGVEGAVTGRRFTTAFDAATAGPADLPSRPRGSDELAHLLFTSGSTGVPKGVMVTHDSVRAFIDWTVRHFGIEAGERLSGHAPLHFDMSTLDIYSALAAGAELHLVPPSLGPDPHALARMIREHELTQWFSVPTALAYLSRFDAVAQDDFPSLRRLMWCGEPLPTPVLAHWMRRLPHVGFTNLYGPTEATVASSFHPVPDVPADETVPTPIGRACDGERLRVLDEDRRPVADDEIGDLYISGVGLSPGYWRDAEKTAAAFVPDPDDPGTTLYRTGDLARRDPDGVLHFLGRADSQIKSRGYRIELGEIEAALVTVTGVRACAVLGVDLGGLEGTTICAVVTTDGDIAPAAPTLRAELGTLLPHYMLPGRWLVLDELPANVNGKVDRPALRALFAPQAAAAA